MHYSHVRYYLINPILGRIKLNFEPINWSDDEKTLVRNQNNWGVFTQLSNNLEFVKDGKDLIKEVFETQGTEAELILERYVAETTSQGYELDYRGHLDLKTYSEQDEKVSIEFLTGGLQNLIESQFDEAYELERGTDINGNQITSLDFETIYWEGRRIFLESKLKTNLNPTTFETGRLFADTAGLQPRYMLQFPQTESVYNSEEISFFQIISQFPNYTLLSDFNVAGTQRSDVLDLNAASLFYLNRNTDEDIINVTINYDFTVNSNYNAFNRSLYDLKISLFKYFDNGSTFDFIETIDFITFNDWRDLTKPEGGRYKGVSTIQNVSLLENEAITFCVWTEKIGAGAYYTVNISNYFFDVKAEQNSTFKPTTFNGIKLYDAFNRMLEMLTGQQNRVISDYFQNGEFQNVMLTSGKHIRNLPNATIATSLKDLYETSNYFNLGWSVEKINNIEKYVVEPKRYFFQPNVIIDLGEVSDLEIISKEDLLFKSMTFGNKKAGDYEEVQGLQEYNALTTYVSHLKTSDTKYEVDGSIRADLVGAELARRKNYEVAPNEDTRYDKENFIINCKPYQTTKWTPKVWQDVLVSEPVVYDPPTAGNLLLTPFRSMQRHANVFNAGMKVYQDKFTRYSTGTGKVETQTQLQNEPVYAENSNIQNSLLEVPIFEAIEYNFKKPLSLDIKKKLRGYTNVNGRDIPNVNFAIKFTYKGQRFTGYILEVSFNDPGQWKLIKQFSNIVN